MHVIPQPSYYYILSRDYKIYSNWNLKEYIIWYIIIYSKKKIYKFYDIFLLAYVLLMYKSNSKIKTTIQNSVCIRFVQNLQSINTITLENNILIIFLYDCFCMTCAFFIFTLNVSIKIVFIVCPNNVFASRKFLRDMCWWSAINQTCKISETKYITYI